MNIHNCIHNWIVDIHLLSWIMYIHHFIKGIYDSVMNIPLEDIFTFGFSHQYAFIASQRIHDAINVITSKQFCDFVST